MKKQMQVIEGEREKLEIELVNKLLAKTINPSEMDELLMRLKPKKGHLTAVSTNKSTLH